MTQNRKAKILEISSYPPPRAGWGVRIAFVRQHLESAGHHCQVLNIGPSRKIRSPDYLDVQNGLDYLRKVFRHAWKGYLIHTHVNGDSPKGLILALAGELFSLMNKRRCVLTFHAGPKQRFFPKDRSHLMAPFFWIVFTLAQRIICNSTAVKENIVSYGISSNKVVPIPAFSQQYLHYTPVDLPRDLADFLKGHQPVLTSYFFLREEFFVESLIDAMRQLASTLPQMGLILIGGDTQSEAVSQMVERAGLKRLTYQAGDLAHDQFMTVLSKAHFYVRTPIKDGVCSSVLEALSLRVPVLAAENGTRPPGVITFKCGDGADLVRKLLHVWNRYDRLRSQIIPPALEDTVQNEAELLVDLALSEQICCANI